MSHFIFKAKRSTGEIYTSEKDAEDRYELYRMVREAGEEVVSLEEKNTPGKSRSFLSHISFFNKVKTIEKINFARNLGAMLVAGLPLSRALSVLEKQSKNKAFKTVISDIIKNINKGTTFSDSLSHFPKVFSPLFVAMVHSGEQSGTLADSLKVISAQMDSIYSLEKRVRGALLYPAVIIGVMITIAILMFMFVIPTLIKTFTEMNVDLPISTRIVIAISDIVQSNGLTVLGLFIVMSAVLYSWSRRASGKRFFHSFILKMPILGVLVQEINTARTARTLSSLIESGVDIVEAISITATVVQNVYFKKILVQAGDSIKKGDLMSTVFGKQSKFYPVFFAEMMSVGEETGKTGEMLLGVAKYYEDDVDQKTKDMSTIIEPFLIVIIGVAVGFFAISMISPMYSLVNVI